SLLSKLGILDFGGIPIYQDVSFKFFFPTKRAGTFSFFGLGGLNKIQSKYYSAADEDLVNEEYEQHGRLGIFGLKHVFSINEKMYVSTTLSQSINGNESKSFRLYSTNEMQEDRNASTANTISRLNSSFNYK